MIVAEPRAPALPALRALARELAASARLPASVYRVQLSPAFGFDAAADLAPYLESLGVGSLYTSPVFEAVPGSGHGYDVTDPTTLRRELGGAAGHDRLCEALRSRSLGRLIDVVPNHMGIRGGSNRYWDDVLENGPESKYAPFFDIDWSPPKTELKGKVLLPHLADFYGKALHAGRIRLEFSGGRLRVRTDGESHPLAPHTIPMVLEHAIGELAGSAVAEADFLEYVRVIAAFRELELAPGSATRLEERARKKDEAIGALARLAGRSVPVREFIDSRLAVFNGVVDDPASFDRLHALLEAQFYRLAYWAVAAEEINYRRFFNINELAAVRTEDERVFRQTHALVFDLVREGKVQGLRIDHPDGLYDPAGYFARIQREFFREKLALSADARFSEEEIEALLDEPEFAAAKLFYVVAEKILDHEEPLPTGWNLHGTVGYEYLNLLNGLFIDPRSAGRFDDLYARFIGHPIDFKELVYDSKKLFARFHMTSEVYSLGSRLEGLAERDRATRDFTKNQLTVAIRETIDCFPVYRTFVAPESVAVTERDRRYVREAIGQARLRAPGLSRQVFNYLESVLLLETHGRDAEESRRFRDFVLRFQQLTGPIMAKGFEDTALYVDNKLLPLNEVGGDPSRFGVEPPEFHRANAERLAKWPGTLLPGSTHDTKRSEDVRLRLDGLSEIPDEWERCIEEWSRLNAGAKIDQGGAPSPKANTEYFIYQMLLGTWPEEPMTGGDLGAFRDRLWVAVLKSIREAKIYTNWFFPNVAYEDAVRNFLETLLKDGPNEFLERFRPFARRIAAAGRKSALSALALRLCSPGVPDVYQGDELWNCRLVDPDNRAPVDFERRVRFLEEIDRLEAERGAHAAFRELCASPEDGRVKLFALSRGLRLRRRFPSTFLEGAYKALEATGPAARHAVAFLRLGKEGSVLAAAGRFFLSRSERTAFWRGTFLQGDELDGEWTDAWSGRTVRAENGRLDLSGIFDPIEAVLLTRR